MLLFPNHVDSTFEPVVYSGGDWQPTLPLSNLSSSLLHKVARSTDLAPTNTTFDVDLTVPKGVRAVCIPKHSISRYGQIRVQGSNEPDFLTPAYDSGWTDVWNTIYPHGFLPWGHPSFWDGKMTEEDASDINVGYICLMSEEVFSRYWRFEISDLSNPAGYIELNRLFISTGWQPSVNMLYGATLGYETDTTSERADVVDYYDRKKGRRVQQFQLSNLPEDEMMYNAFDMMRKLGKDRQVYFIFDPDDTFHMHRRAFLATMRELSPIEFPYYSRASKAFNLLEVL